MSNLLYGEKVHVGDSNEEEITEDLTKLLSYMNEEDESDIIKAIVSHYIFEYIHLFYNGNGRLGRYLLSSYLAYKLDPFSALSISEAIKNNKNKYGDIFSEVTYF
ncbi:Fic family protein [Helcococcus kunzii]|uniref:Fic family protein n=2 Tax=Helcococcus kunzii TaxID=40091 RepID=UPI0035CD3A33